MPHLGFHWAQWAGEQLLHTADHAFPITGKVPLLSWEKPLFCYNVWCTPSVTRDEAVWSDWPSTLQEFLLNWGGWKAIRAARRPPCSLAPCRHWGSGGLRALGFFISHAGGYGQMAKYSQPSFPFSPVQLEALVQKCCATTWIVLTGLSVLPVNHCLNFAAE